jgi:sugar phosphate isomerase/epimerase
MSSPAASKIKPAFSTVACPDWTLAQIGERLEAWGFLGIEMRTFGTGSTQFACDPALTAPAKTRGMVRAAGMDVCSLATGIAYDEPVDPPVIGNVISDTERSIRQTKSAIDLAVQLECSFVRVFGFEIPSGESRKSGLARIASRLAKAADYCRNSGVKLMVENGGTFNRAAELAELLDKVASPLVSVAYSVPVGKLAGESITDAANVLGDRLACVKVKDMKGTTPVALGHGELQVAADLAALARSGFEGWCVFEFDRAWLPAGASVDVDAVLTASAKTLFQALGGPVPASRVAARV